MKKLKNSWAILTMTAIAAFGLIACGSDSEEDITPTPEKTPEVPAPTQGDDETKFPAFATLTGNAGDTLTLSFNVNKDWQLTTNSLWCKLGDGLYDISGSKGAQEVKVIITDANLGFSVDSTDITMKIGTESQVIAKVYREANSYEIKVTEYGLIEEEQISFDENNPIEIDHYGSIALAVEANFDWIPMCDIEWLNVSKEENVLTLTVLDGYTQNPIMNADDIITFSNENEILLSIHVSYTGMNPEGIIIEPSSKWNLQISTDGTTYSESSLSDDETVTSPAPYTAKLTALNNAYTILSYNLDATVGMTLMDEASAWFTVTDDKAGNVSVSFSTNEGGERSGYLLAIPNGHYEKIKDTLENAICDKTTEYLDMKPEYEKYTIAHFVQQANITSDLADITAKYLTGGMKSIPVEMLSSMNNKEGIFDYVTKTFNVASVGYLTPKTAASGSRNAFQIVPSVEEWCENEEPDENDVYPPVVEIFVDENSTDNVVSDFAAEPWQDNGKMALQISIPQEKKGSVIYVVFKKNGQNKQVAVLDVR